jgi:hypothetical protein
LQPKRIVVYAFFLITALFLPLILPKTDFF